MAQPPDETERQRFIALAQRAMQHFHQTVTEDAEQTERNADTVAALPEVLTWLQQVPLEIDLWQQLVAWSERTLPLETQELVNTLLIELYPSLVDFMQDRMGTDERLELTPDMPLVRLKQLIDTHYDWALREDFDDPRAHYWFWYRSVEKEEPRLGIRHVEPGIEKELPLAIAPRIQRAHNALTNFLNDHPRALVVDFLMANPSHKNIVRRIQSMVETPYGDIRANLWHRDMKPMHLLRAKLSFFGASRFDPKSDRWVRITLFQGAPLVEELNAEPANLVDFDDWSFPLEPSNVTSPVGHCPEESL